MAEFRPKEIFVSHASQDRAFADQLVKVLRHHGLPCWYSRSELIGAQIWHDEIGAALARCDTFIVVLSPRSIESEWVKRELINALNNTARYAGRIVPILLQSCDYEKLSWTLTQSQFVDFSKTVEQGYIDLLRIWGIGFKGLPAQEPASKTYLRPRARRRQRNK